MSRLHKIEATVKGFKKERKKALLKEIDKWGFEALDNDSEVSVSENFDLYGTETPEQFEERFNLYILRAIGPCDVFVTITRAYEEEP